MASKFAGSQLADGTVRRIGLLGFTVALVSLLAPAADALDASMFVEGAGGPIACDAASPPGREGSFPVLAFGYSIDVPLDPASGGLQGRRQHKPVTVRIDSGCNGVPLLYKAVFQNETLETVQVRFYRRGREGESEHYYSVELTDALIVGITAAGAGSLGEPELLVSLSFRAIKLTYVDGSVEAEDDWRAPPS